MKALLPTIALLFVSATLGFAKEGWLENLDEAKAKAKAEHKKILLDFTGSDWCGWCMKLDKEVFSQQEWKDYAAKNYVLVELDFPKRKELAAEQKEQNQKLAKKFQVQGFPTIVVLSEGGNKKGELGYVEGGPQAFIKELEKQK